MENGATCDVFGICGGCSLLNVPYEVQLADKDAVIVALFEGIVPANAIRPTKGMAHPFNYRNKVIAPFVAGDRAHVGSKILTGMYAAGTHRVIEASGGCLLENSVAHKVAQAVKAIMRKHDIAPYDEDTGHGFMRHAVVRVGHNSGEVLVVLVTNADDFPYSKSFCRELVRRVPAITTIVQSVNMRQTNVVLGDAERVLYGPGFILDTLCGLSFRISAHSFYQVSAGQTEVLYETAMELAALQGGETVLDAYCGTGTIGLVAAARGAGRVIGVDSAPSSVRDARQNAKHNGIKNAEFVTADATEYMRALTVDVKARLAADNVGAADAAAVSSGAPVGVDAAGKAAGTNIDTLFMDPPRAGSTPEFLAAVTQLAPKRIVYVSCNPETQVRDVRHLLEAGYTIEVVQPVDMFPHTPHIECVVSLAT